MQGSVVRGVGGSKGSGGKGHGQWTGAGAGGGMVVVREGGEGGPQGVRERLQSFAQPYICKSLVTYARLPLAETAPPTRAGSWCEAGYATLNPPSHGALCAEGEPNLRGQRRAPSETPCQIARGRVTAPQYRLQRKEGGRSGKKLATRTPRHQSTSVYTGRDPKVRPQRRCRSWPRRTTSQC